MKKIYFLILFISATVFATAQQTIIDENFDNFVSGQKLAQQAGNPWTTWSNAPGGTEDPLVSDVQFYSSNNSVNVGSGNDCVLLLGDSISGRYKFSFYIYIPSGKLGYYNLLADFNGSNSEWGMQIFFDAGGQGSIDAGGGSAASFTYNYDQWIYMENYVDLDNDWAEVFVDGDYLIGWQWTLGSFGDGVSLKLSAANFYGWDGSKSLNGTPDYYFDDVLHQEMPLGEAPSNLQASVDGSNVSLTWDAPVNGTPDTYYVMRNNELIAITTDLFYDDVIELPGTYSYEVKAFYTANGLSNPTDAVEVIIEGGTSRDKVLLEIATGTWCTYCPGAAMGADDLVENGHEVAVIEYHSGDSYETPQSVDRNSYYSVTGYPTSTFDGIRGFSGGSHSESLYPNYLPYYNERIGVSSIFDLQMDVVQTSESSFDVTLNTEQLWDYTAGDLRLHLVLTESHIPENWQGQTEVSFVCREMYPGSNGADLNLQNTGDTQEDNYTVDVSSNFDIMECELVAFIQDNATKEVMNSIKFSLGQLVGINEEGESFTRVFPNPSNGTVNIESASRIKNIKVYNLQGQLVYNVSLDQENVRLDLGTLNQGIYMMEINTEKGKRTEKLSIR
ncbi:MAG: T9SS type A sorting domain-containing protein [Chlorobi bacterium]|nr:T9SS type A sorting domain-containing protein [Chlorobiota bacterium]